MSTKHIYVPLLCVAFAGCASGATQRVQNVPTLDRSTCLETVMEVITLVDGEKEQEVSRKLLENRSHFNEECRVHERGLLQSRITADERIAKIDAASRILATALMTEDDEGIRHELLRQVISRLDSEDETIRNSQTQANETENINEEILREEAQDLNGASKVECNIQDIVRNGRTIQAFVCNE